MVYTALSEIGDFLQLTDIFDPHTITIAFDAHQTSPPLENKKAAHSFTWAILMKYMCIQASSEQL